MIKRVGLKRYRLLFIVSGIFCVAGWVFGQDGGVGTATAESRVSLREALSLLAEGKVSALREAIGESSGKGEAAEAVGEPKSEAKASEITGGIEDLLSKYQELDRRLRGGYEESYQETYNKLKEALEKAKWRQAVERASAEYPLENEEKTKFEKEAKEEVWTEWLSALGQLGICESMCEELDVPNTVDPALRSEILNRSLEIAGEYEKEGRWLDSYSKVYYYLTGLFKTNPEYDQHARQLIRKAMLVNLYVPDPAQDDVSWQERKKGVTFDVFSTALSVVEGNYVEVPDYNAMCKKGVEYCVLLSEIPKLGEVFGNAAKAEAAERYQRELREILTEMEGMPIPHYGYYYLLSTLRKVLGVNKNTLELPDEVILSEFSEGAFSALDSYTYVIWPGDADDFKKDMTGKFYGVGVVIMNNEGRLTVDSLLEDSPAGEAGIDAGDIIAAIDGKSTMNISLEMAVRRITGPKDTQVVLTIERKGFEKPKDFTITRREIVVQSVKGLNRDAAGEWQYFLDPQKSVGYIRLTNFYEETTPHLRELLVRLRGQGMKGLILDLRNNSGGFLSTAVDVVNMFIEEGAIVSTRRRGGEPAEVDMAERAKTIDAEMPLVILVNGISASASEIVSGSLQDHKRALIVGTHTYGKGNVQTIQPLAPSKAQLKITIAYYYLPSNRRVHRNPEDKLSKDYGVKPDLEVELAGKQITEMMKVRRESGILHQNGTGTGTWTVYKADEVVRSDPQLEMAMICLKAKMMAKTLGIQQGQSQVVRN